MEKIEGLKLIRPGSIGLVKTVGRLKFSNVFQKLILWWGRNIEKEDYVFNHTFTYWGSGRHELIEANGGKVRIRKVDQFLYPYNQVYFFHNVNTTVENLQAAKNYAYSTVFERRGLDIKGRLYDFGELLRFAFPKINDNPNADICSRNTWDIQKVMKNPIIDEDSEHRISPSRIGDWLIDRVSETEYKITGKIREGMRLWTGTVDTGWRCSVVWDRSTFRMLAEVI